MSCMRNVDPYNNAPPPRTPQKPQPSQPMMEMQSQQQHRPDPQTENRLLMADLQLAVSYIQQLGGTWPPPGH